MALEPTAGYQNINLDKAGVARHPQTGDEFGHGRAGDINGDGYADLVVGAHARPERRAQVGAVYVFWGSETGMQFTAAGCRRADFHQGSRDGQPG